MAEAQAAQSSGAPGISEALEAIRSSEQSSTPPPLREEQVANAVAFLGHEKVRGSTAEVKRSFLVRKGLTEQEIEEAMQRVPQAPPAAIVPHAPPAVQAPPMQPPPQLLAAPAPAPGLRWSQVALGAGLMAATAYAVQSYVYPAASRWVLRSSWYNDLWAGPRKRLQDMEHSVDQLKGTTRRLQESTDGLLGAVETLSSRLAAVQDAPPSASGEVSAAVQALQEQLTSLQQTSPAAEPPPAATPVLHQLQDIKRMLGSMQPAPAGASPPSPTGSGSISVNSRRVLMPPAKHTSRSAAAWARSPPPPPASTPATENGVVAHPAPGRSGSCSPAVGPPPPHSASYTQVLEMLERGETPPGIRTDIVDTPPEGPAAPLPASSLVKRPKPWEVAPSRGQGAAEGVRAYGMPPDPLWRPPAMVTASGASGEDAGSSAPADGVLHQLSGSLGASDAGSAGGGTPGQAEAVVEVEAVTRTDSET